MNEYEEDVPDTAARALSERHVDDVREQDGFFVEAVRLTRMPMIVTDAGLPGNPIIYAITNATKYAFPSPRSGTILAQVRRSEPGWVELVVRDDGVGITHLRDGSLGYGLVRSLVEQIGGTLRVESKEGLIVTLSFPDGCRPQDGAS